jgi:hypothetical protein
MSSVKSRLEKVADKYSVNPGSIAEHSVLFDKAASGDYGEETRQALHGICQSIEAPSAEKTASVYDAGNLSENSARKARLDQLLKR